MRAAVIGLGLGAAHAEAYDASDEVTSIALCDTNEDSAQKLATSLSKPVTCYARLDDLFASGAVDVVSIVTPDQFHVPHAEAAVAKGAHVLLTKPIATDLDGARRVIEGAAAANVRLMVAQERRLRPRYRRVKELITSGALGDLIYLRLQAYQNAQKKFERAPWYASKEAGRTAITGSGIHQVDLVRHLGGEVKSVRALGNKVGPIEFHHYKTIVALFELESEAVGEVAFTYEATPKLGGDDVTIIGSKGSVAGDRFVTRDGAEETLPTHDDDMRAGSRACVRAFLEAIRSGGPVPVTGEDAYASLAAAMAADRACETGGVVTPEGLRA